MSHIVSLSIESCKQIDRLRNLLRNPHLEKWYYHQFYSHGLVPVDPKSAHEEILRWQGILDYIIEQAVEDGFIVPPEEEI